MSDAAAFIWSTWRRMTLSFRGFRVGAVAVGTGMLNIESRVDFERFTENNKNKT